MGAKIQAFDIFQTPLSSHYPLPLTVDSAMSSSQNGASQYSTSYRELMAKLYCFLIPDSCNSLVFS
jgi:hypothetical protein